MAENARTFAVIGLGTFGGTVAKDLVRFGNHVIGLDIDERRVSVLADDLNQTLILDAREEGVLKEAGLDGCDVALVAVGSCVETSTLATITLKTLGVDTVWAKASSKNHHRILTKIGADRVFHPEQEYGHHIAQMLNNRSVRDYMSLGNGEHVVNFRVPESLDGQSLDDLPHATKFDLRCIGVLRGSKYLGQDGAGCVLEKDDLMLLLGKRDDLRRFADQA